MKIISYNVNGIQAAMKKGLNDWITAAQPDVMGIQEIKARQDQIGEEISDLERLEYHSYLVSGSEKGVQRRCNFIKRRTQTY